MKPFNTDCKFGFLKTSPFIQNPGKKLLDYSNLPIYRETRQSDMRIVAHKRAGLTAQNFTISVLAINYVTCPMQDFDSLRIKKILHLPASSEITMIIGCRLPKEQGVYGDRFRIPFEEVYFKL
ncbi:nitroreductase family protein [Flavobacterium sp. LB3P122]|uniref:nitroreductase family protein n=1 Tax=Flavobacterium algoriphilum TaxID=3398738 RepID=UPI003A853CB1